MPVSQYDQPADDYSADLTTTGLLTPGGGVSGVIESGIDQDWLRISLVAGHAYGFSLEGRDSGTGSLGDPLLRLRDAAGNQIAYNQDGGFGRDAYLTYIAPAGGTYYLAVEAQNGSAGSYTLSARDLGSGYSATPVDNAISLTGTATLDGLIQGSAWQFSGAHVLTYSFNDFLDEDNTTFGGPWTEQQKDAVREALLAWQAVADISFVEMPGSDTIEHNTADLAFGHVGDALYPAAGLGFFPSPAVANQFLAEMAYTRADYPRLEGDVLIDDYAVEMQYLAPGQSGFWVSLHELGHALGLKHPFDDGGNSRPTFESLGIAAQDDGLWTVMSYNQSDASLTAGFTATPMRLDILAIQWMYGVNSTYHTGDNTYYLVDDGAVRTIWDGGGNDWLDAGGLALGIHLSLAAGSIVEYGASATAIAFGVAIENARGGNGDDTLIGTAASNTLEGGVGADSLDGGAGADLLIGGDGNDLYHVDHRGDQIVELNAQGTDTVRAALSWTLGANLENLEVTGAYRYSASGNALANHLTGNAGHNLLDGGVGADSMSGGLGDDTYVVDNVGDVIQEDAGAGNDTVLASVNWSLGANLENLTFTGTKNLAGTGNGLDNHLTGNGGANHLDGGAGNDVLDGGSGHDILTGGMGSDTFAFSAPLNALRNVDTITDFVSGTDRIELSSLIFRDMGFSGSPGSDAFFCSGGAAQDADDRILYDPGNGALYYDADGTGALAAVQFAVLNGRPSLLYSDFVVG